MMFVSCSLMDHIILYLLLTCSTQFVIHSHPINNGFSVKFSPILTKEEMKPRLFGALFAKKALDLTIHATERRENLMNSPCMGCSNQIAKILFPFKYNYNDYNDSETWNSEKVENLPILQESLDDYKILVATAPPHIRIGKGNDSKPVVVYIVLPGDNATHTNESDYDNIPSVYFIHKSHVKVNSNKEGVVETILIVDSNRTVTGLKSKQVAKFVKFTNKLINRYKYEVVK